MQIYLPIAEMAVSAELIVFISIGVGFLSGFFGVGGGFLTTPFLIFLGIPPAIAVGSTQPNQVAKGVSGMLGHLKKGNVDIKIGLIMLVGGTIGSFTGVMIFKFLQYLGQIDFAISLLYFILLSSIGALMMIESIRSLTKKNKPMRMEFNKFRVPDFIHKLPLKMRFPRSNLYISALLPAGVGFVGGLIASILGVGGGFLLIPAMIYIIGIPPTVVAGTSLFQIVFTTSIATTLHAMTNHTVDIILSLMLIAGGVIGAQAGVVFAGRIKDVYARMILATIIICVSLALSGQLFLKPDEIFTTVLR